MIITECTDTLDKYWYMLLSISMCSALLTDPVSMSPSLRPTSGLANRGHCTFDLQLAIAHLIGKNTDAIITWTNK